MKLSGILIAVALAALPATATAQSGAPSIRSQDSDSATLEVAPQANPGHPPNAATLGQPPEAPPSEPVLVIPQASLEFAGRWGGHLSLARSSGGLAAPQNLS